MEAITNNLKIALLIDAENISPTYTKTIFDELSKYGTATLKKIYGDWTIQQMVSWKEILSEHALQPTQQFQNTSGKNSSDSALIIDAMDILYTKSVDAFCIVSSDSDFTRLITRLREDGKYVIGMGEKKAARSLVNVCDKFIYLDVLTNEEGEEPSATKGETKQPFLKAVTKGRNNHRQKRSALEPDKVEALAKIVDELRGDDEDAIFSEVCNRMIKLFPDFDSRNYGYQKLSDLVAEGSNRFEIRKEQIKGNKNAYILFIKNRH
ncbi:MAG: NYN domain-containing protein [Bacilli bacterium]|jgi:uncharacterized protein (TIGR00288 family)